MTRRKYDTLRELVTELNNEILAAKPEEQSSVVRGLADSLGEVLDALPYVQGELTDTGGEV